MSLGIKNTFRKNNPIHGWSSEEHADTAIELGAGEEKPQPEKYNLEQLGDEKSVRSSDRRSSLELRRLPPEIVMALTEIEMSETEQRNFDDEVTDERKKPLSSILRRTCLKSKYPLRKQLMLTFGTTITVTILLVMLASILVTVHTTNRVKSEGRNDIGVVTGIISKASSRYVAELLSSKIPLKVPSLVAEVVMDRFAGYPHHQGYDDDSAVPFFDIITQRNKYPLNSTYLPLDWQINPNVNEDNYQEHVQNRWSWYGKDPIVSTRSAAYFMQGTCDPSKVNNCTDDNNDIEAGGLVTPSPTNKRIAQKAADLNFILKSIYEQHQDVRDIGVYFANAGAGSILQYPHYQFNSNGSYKSKGCEWMSQPNPFDKSKPIASDEEIQRCRPEGAEVNYREYNVLEHEWCQKMALNPLQTHVFGPEETRLGDNLWYISIGRAVYDRLTNEFIACVLMNVSIHSMDDIVSRVKILSSVEGGGTRVTLVKWDEEGTLVASPEWDWSSATEPTNINNPNIERGVTKEAYEKFKSLVDFRTKWDHINVREQFEGASYETDGLLISAFPVPVPPKEYTEEYAPNFMVILSLEKKKLEKPLNKMEGEANDTEKGLIIFIVACGIAGLVASFICISVASNYLTKPLKWMNDITNDIVNDFGQDYEDKDKDIDYGSPQVFRCSPRTELNALVEEFQKMISHFSGRGSAKVEGNKLVELKNYFNLFADFSDLYKSRVDANYKYNYFNMPSHDNISSGTPIKSSERTNNDKNTPLQDSTTESFVVPRRCHFGQNIVQSNLANDASHSNLKESTGGQKGAPYSPLFWWIMGLIVTPLLISTILISAIVAWRLSDELPSLFTVAEKVYIDLEKDYLSSTVNLRSDFTALVTKRGLQELHVLDRVAGWLFFGGIERSSSFDEITSATNECSQFGSLDECPHFRNKTTAPCACEWNDNRGYNQTCYNYSEDPRYLQKQQFSVQTQDTWPNGDRNSSGFPNNSFSPMTTDWLVNVADAAGSYKGLLAEGYETTYDRLRVASALSVISMPLYNFDKSENKPLTTLLSFEADGMIIGFSGCNRWIDKNAHWRSTEENNAPNLRPELCKAGKYGYDPRCRGWYDSGRKNWEKGFTNSYPLFVTAPYVFAINRLIGQSATLPLVDPNIKKHIGQTLLDFSPNSVFDAFHETNTLLLDEGFPFVITPDGDTVIGPGSTKITNDAKPPIKDLIFQSGDVNIDEFEDILDRMRKGENGTAEFSRLKEDGSTEKMYISFSPVNSTNFYPLNGSDFSRGVKEYHSMIYSIALVLPENTHFRHIMDSLRQNVNIAIVVLCVVVVIGTATVTFILARVTMSITTPMSRLLEEIKKVNRLEDNDSFLEFLPESGSRDVHRLEVCFDILFKVVKVANSAYFSGNLEVAHKVLVDALSAFKRLNNKKAIGVTSNNLGNIMCAMYRTMSTTGDDMICGMTKEQIMSNGTKYFIQAIKLGEEAYDEFYEEEGWSKNCLVFMQHLSNRYFNRAIFLLAVQEDHETPDSAKQMAFRDLQIVYDMDIEVVDQCIEMGIVRSKKEHFDSIMGRVRGLHGLSKDSYPDDWNLGELLDDALRILKSVINSPSSNDLFSTLGPAGRMQQLDCQLINHLKSTTDDLTKAASIAIRMLVEDEYILNDAYTTAIGVLIEYVGSELNEKNFERSLDIRRELMAIRSAAMIENENCRRSSEKDSFAINHMSFGPKTTKPTSDDKARLASAVECNRGDVTMETF